MTGPRRKPRDQIEPRDPSTEKERKCLKCGRKFLSTWAGNRICPNCSGRVNRDWSESMHPYPMKTGKS